MQLQVLTDGQTVELTCKLDTGAEGNVLPLSEYLKLIPEAKKKRNGAPQGLKPSTTRITAFGGSIVKQLGTCMLTLRHRHKVSKQEFYVVELDAPVIIGLPACRDLELP